MSITPLHPSANNRKDKRVAVDRPIKVTYQQEIHTSKMINLSVSGLGLISHLAFKDQSQIEVHFKVPFYNELSQIKLNAQVVHCTPVRGQYHIGLKFHQVSPHQQKVISNYIQFKENNSKL